MLLEIPKNSNYPVETQEQESLIQSMAWFDYHPDQNNDTNITILLYKSKFVNFQSILDFIEKGTKTLAYLCHRIALWTSYRSHLHYASISFKVSS